MPNLPSIPPNPGALLDTAPVWRALSEAHRHLAELKGLCESLPNPNILLETLAIQEAKDSSEIENIVTTHDELYASEDQEPLSAAAKEVRNYVDALRIGFREVKASGLIRLDTILAIQAELERNRAGIRQLPGTVLRITPQPLHHHAQGRLLPAPPGNPRAPMLG